MKNKYIYFLVLAVLIAGFFFLKNNQLIQNKRGEPQTSTEMTETKPVATLVLDDGEKISTYSAIAAQNAFEILSIVTERENIPLVTKQYDFGVFVQKIREKESGADMAWIYSINGKSGEVAADKAEIISGDTVEWKYTKSIY